MENNRTILILIYLLVLPTLLAGITEEGGISGPLNSLGIGGIGSGMGGAYTSLSEDGTGLYYNPAGMNYIGKYNIVTLNYSSTLLGIGNILYLSYIGAIKGKQKIGVSFLWQGFNNLQVYNNNQVKGGVYSISFIQIALSSAFRIFRNFDTGFNIKFFYNNIDTYSINSFDMDIGFLYRFFKYIKTGITFHNLLPLGYKFIQEKEDIPLNIRWGISYDLHRYHFVFSYDTEKYIEPSFDSSSFKHHFGIKYTLYKYINIVAGYDLENFTFGLNLNISSFSFYSGTVRNTDTGNLNFGISYKIKQKSESDIGMDYFYQGIVAYQNKDYRTAIKYFQKVLDIRYDPTAEFYLNNAKAYLQSEQWMSEEEKAIVGMKLELARKYIEQKFYGNAIKTLREILNINPENESAKKLMAQAKEAIKSEVEKHYKKALELFKVNKYKDSLKECNLALDLNPEHKPSLDLKKENENILKDVLAQQRREEQKKTEAETLFKQGLLSYQNANWSDAINNFQKSYNLVPSKETLDYLNRAKERLNELKLTEKNKMESEVHLKAGIKLYNQKKWKEALSEFESAVNLYPDNKVAVEYLQKTRDALDSIINKPLEEGKEDLQNGQLYSAITNFQKVLKVDPGNEVARTFLNKAKGMIKDAIKLNLKLAKNAFEKEEYSSALGYYREVIKLDKNNKEAKKGIKLCKTKIEKKLKYHFNKGIDYFNKGEYLKALTEFKTTLNIDPEYHPARDMLTKSQKLYEENKTKILIQKNLSDGMDYFYNKNYEQARIFFKKVLELDPENQKAKEYLKKCEDNLKDLLKEEKIAKIITDGLIYYRKKKFAEAIKKWQEVKEIDPQNKIIDEYISYARKAQEESMNKYYNMGVDYYNKGDYLKAKEFLEKALETNPNHSKAKKKLREVNSIIFSLNTEKKSEGKKYFKKGDYDKAIEDFQFVLKIESDNDEFKDLLHMATKAKNALEEGKNLMKEKKYADAIEKFSQVLDYNSNDPVAKKLINEAVKEGKKQASTWFNEGLSYYKKGDLKRAHSRFVSVLKANPSNNEARNMLNKISTEINKKCADYYNKGLSAYKNKKYKEAIKYFNKVLRLKNRYKDTSILLSKATKKYNKIVSKDRAKLQEKIKEYLYTGIKLYRDGKLREAIVEWKKVLKISPNHPKAIKYINRAKYKLSQLEKIKE